MDRHGADADAAPRHRDRRGRRARLRPWRRTRARLRGDRCQRDLHSVRTALALLLVLAAAPAMAGPREDALAGLANRGDVEVRRRAAVTLAETGTMADVPALVSALRDADERVRGLAVNPNLESVRETVEGLRAFLIEQRRNAI